MKKWFIILGLPPLAIGTCLFVAVGPYGKARRTKEDGGPAASPIQAGLAEIQARIQDLTKKVEALALAREGAPVPPGNPAGAEGAGPSGSAEILSELQGIRKALEDLPALKAPPPAEAEFAEGNGYEVADGYLEQGRFATAASGYLSFLKHHPSHPNAAEILKKARDAYQKAGYSSRAVELQKDLLENYPVEDRFREVMTLANLEKETKRYPDAIQHVEEACAGATNLEEKLWGLGFRAWYIELSQGPEAGLRAYNEALSHAVELGLGESNPAKSHRQKIERLEKIIEASRARR